MPPGGFSLKYAFPDWFGEEFSENDKSSRPFDLRTDHLRLHGVPSNNNDGSPRLSSLGADLKNGETENSLSLGSRVSSAQLIHPSIYHVLKHLKASFEDESVLDSLPLEAAVSSGAWHAWAAHSRTAGSKTASDSLKGAANSHMIKSGRSESNSVRKAPTSDWNWDGVWVKRVKASVEASISEPMLYGIDDDDPVSRPLNALLRSNRLIRSIFSI